MAEKNSTIVLRVDLRTDAVEAGLKQTEQSARSTGVEVSKAFDAGNKSIQSIVVTTKQAASSFEGLASIARNLVGIAASLTAAFGSVTAAINLIKIDEKNTQALRAFQEAATFAGVSSESLAAKLNAARGNFADLEDVLLSSTKVLNEVGGQMGNSLPALLEIATKASIRFGVDTVDAFERLTEAIVTGSTKQLRSIGIYVDASQAAKEYAASIGLTVDQLTDAERRQANLNAILNAGNRTFRDIDSSQRTVTQGLIALKNTLSDLVEALSSSFNSTFGPSIKNAISQLTQFARSLTESITPPNDEADRLREELNKINSTIFELQKQAESGPSIFQKIFEGFNKLSGSPITQTIEAQIESLQKSKARIVSELNKLNLEVTKSQAASQIESARQVAEVDAQLQSILLANRSAFNKKLDELNYQARQAQLISRLVLASEDEKLRIQTELLELEHQKRMQSIRDEFANKRGISEYQINLLLEAEQSRHYAALEQLNAQFNQRSFELSQRRQQVLINAEAAFNAGLLQITYAFVESLGAALVDGGNAWSSFEAFALNTFGSMLINLGQAAIGIGVLVEGIKAAVLALSGPFAIIAGVSLIALGGVLKALAGKKLRSALGRSSGNTFATPPPVFGGQPVSNIGPVSGGPVTSQDFASRESQRLNQAGVTVNIQGSIFDSDATGSRIVNLINDAFKRQGVRVTTGAA